MRCIALSLSLLNNRWADGSTASRAVGNDYITDFGLNTLQFRNSAVGLGVEKAVGRPSRRRPAFEG